MSNILLALKNSLDAGVTWYGDQDVGHELTKLSDPNFSRSWVYTPGANVDGAVAKFAFSVSPVFCTNHIAFCRHNGSVGAQIRVRASMARFDADLRSDGPHIHGITFSGGVNGTCTNEYGVQVAATCPRYEHDRRYYENGFLWSEDLSNPAWTPSQCKPYFDGKTVAFVDGNNSQIIGTGLQLYNDTYEVMAQVRLVSGDPQFKFKLYNGLVDIPGQVETATSQWKWFRASIATGRDTFSGSGNASILKNGVAGILQIRKMQIRRGASLGKYRKTTVARRFQRRGVIGEAAATNNLLRTGDFTNAVWGKSGSPTVTPDVALAPDNTLQMDRLNFPAATDYFYQDFAFGGVSRRAASLVFRPDGSTATNIALSIVWYGGGVVQGVTVNFNATTGAKISASQAGGATVYVGDVVDLGNGYYRAYVIGVGSDAANTVVRTQIQSANAGHNLCAWGAQNELNYVTTYIPTAGATVTRTKDSAFVDASTWVPYVWNASEGTVCHEVMASDFLPGDVQMLNSVWMSGTTGNEIQSRFFWGGAGTNHTYDITVVNSSVVQLDSPNPSSLAVGAVHRQAFRYRTNDYYVAVDGVQYYSPSGTVGVPSITTIDLLFGVSTTCFLRRFTIWPTAKSNAEVVAISAGGPAAIEYDSGWSDILQAPMQGDVPANWGFDYDVIKSFPSQPAEWVRVELYDPEKVSSLYPFQIGRAFMGKVTMQPASNAEFGLGNAWIERSATSEAKDGRRFFTDHARVREVTFSLPWLTHTEAALLHEAQGVGGVQDEVLYLPDPSDEAECQRYGFVGLLEKLDPLRYPLVNNRATAFQIRDKR